MTASTKSSASGGTLVRQTMEAVTEHIRQARLKAGDELPSEAELAKNLKVSRAVIREAFGALAALRVIDVGNGRKARVAALDSSPLASALDHAVNTEQVTVAQVWDVRRTLERRTAALAALYRTDEQAAQILGHAKAMKQYRDDFARMTKHDIALHETIAAASHNLLFAQIVASFSPQINEAVPTAWRTRTTERQRSTILHRHLAIAQAIVARDPKAAEKAMDLHFDDSIKRLLDAGAGQLT